MSKYSAEEVRMEVKLFAGYSATHHGIGGKLMDLALAFAERIEADESAVPVASLHADGYWAWNGTPPHESNYAGWRMDVFTHPSAQAAQVDAEIAAEVLAYADELYGDAAERVPFVGPTHGGGGGIVNGSYIDGHPGYTRVTTVAEPVTQGEAVELPRYAICEEGRLLYLRRVNDGDLCKYADVHKSAFFASLIADKSAQPRAVPDGWVMVPREPTVAMLESAQRSNGGKQLPRFSVLCTRWKAMLAAAPLPGESA